MHPDGLVAPRLAGLPVGRQKQPLGLPSAPPLLVAELGVLERVTELGEPPATTAHRYPTCSQPALDPGQLGLQVLQPTLLGEPLRPAGIPAHLALRAADGNRQARADRATGVAQRGPAVQQVPLRPLPLVVGGPRDRPRPTTGRLAGHVALAGRAPVRCRAEPAAPGKIGAGQTAKVFADRPHHGLIAGRQPQPGLDPGACWRGDHERLTDRTHVPMLPGHPTASPSTSTGTVRLAPPQEAALLLPQRSAVAHPVHYTLQGAAAPIPVATP